MSTNHATALYFEGKDEAAKKRLQKLKAAGFTTERPRRAFETSVHFLTRKGPACPPFPKGPCAGDPKLSHDHQWSPPTELDEPRLTTSFCLELWLSSSAP